MATATERRGGFLTAVLAGAAYFGGVFTLGFAVGVLRELVLVERLGLSRTLAVSLEIPLMLAGSWLICLALVRNLAIAPERGPRLAMGGVAFVLLMAAEATLATLMLGHTLSSWIASFQDTAPLVGLAGQAIFALIPLIAARLGR